MHKPPFGARFTVASRNGSPKPLSDMIFKVLKMVFNHVEGFHRKRLFYTCFKKFWVVENSFPINAKKIAKSISTFDFATLYTTIPHNLLIKFLSEVINFAFKSKTRNNIGFSKKLIYRTSKGCGNRYLSSQT